MTPQEFAAAYLPTAETVSSATGIDAYVLLAQWAVETAWGSAIYNANNLGNIRCSPTSFCQYANLQEFADAAIATWRNGYYGAVLATAGAEAQLIAIGESPWDAGHYNNGGGPGSSLVAAFAQLEDDMYTDADRAFDRDADARVAALISGAKTFTAHDGTVVPVAVTLPDILAAVKAVQAAPAPDLLPVLAAIADLKAHPAVVADPTLASVVDAIEAQLKAGLKLDIPLGALDIGGTVKAE